MQSRQAELAERALRYDGVSIISPAQVARHLLMGVPPAMLRLVEHDADTERFNEEADEPLALAGPEPVKLKFGWKLSAEYAHLNIEEYFISRGVDHILKAGYTADQQVEAMQRISNELTQVHQRGMVEFVRTVIYVLDTFRQHNVLWGVGRGSSCASYLLFLAGLHVVDCIKYDVPMAEFFHD